MAQLHQNDLLNTDVKTSDIMGAMERKMKEAEVGEKIAKFISKEDKDIDGS